MVMVLADFLNPRAIRIHWHHCAMLKTMYCRYDTAMVITPSLFGSKSNLRPSDSLRAMLKNDLLYVRPCFLGHFVAQSDMHPFASLLLAHFKSDGVSYPSALLQCQKWHIIGTGMLLVLFESDSNSRPSESLYDAKKVPVIHTAMLFSSFWDVERFTCMFVTAILQDNLCHALPL